MNRGDFLLALAAHAVSRPAAPALEDGEGRSVTYGDLPNRIGQAARPLAAPPRVLALLAGNGIPWVLADLAALSRGVPLLPLPGFFSDGQIAHALRSAGADLVATDDPARVLRIFPSAVLRAGGIAGLALLETRLPAGPESADRITFTSGTTGTPKGVRLSAAAMLTVADSLATALGTGPADRHLSLLPLPVLLENLGGVYRALIGGGTAVLPPPALAGVKGSSACDAGGVLAALAGARATTTILMPAHLGALLDRLEAGGRVPPALRFAGVGGARTDPALLERADAAGLPVFEGYGLTEAASVVALNLPGARRPGSVGRPLPHARVRISPDGEVLVRGALFLGYLGAEAPRTEGGYLPTGDLGRLDADGFLHLMGRRREVLITSFGRNLSPGWIEGLLREERGIDSAVVFGEGREGPCAVVSGPCGEAAARDAVRRVNRSLPDYARVRAVSYSRTPVAAGTCGERERIGRARERSLVPVDQDMEPAIAGRGATWVSTRD